MSVIHGANYGTPTLDLNFAKNKSLIDTVSGRDLVTFTRSQTGREATYVDSDGLIKTASADTPRFDHNPSTGESLGLLVEEARTNLVTYSQEFDNAAWTKNASTTITTNTVTAPDGTVTADTMTVSSGLANTYRTVNPSLPAVFSVFVKQGTSTTVSIYDGNWPTGATFNFSTETISVSGTGITASFQKLSNGWYRIWYVKTSAWNNFVGIILEGTGTTVHIWSAQLESGSFPTSYIPTGASTVTRSADVASITGTNFSRWYNQSEGTLFGQFIIPPFSSNTVNSPYVYKIGTSANLTGTGFYIGNNTNQEGSLIYGSAIAHGDIAAGTRVKNAIGYTQSNGTASATVNGAAVSFGTSGTIPIPASDKIDIGNNNSDGRFYLNSTINRITYYPTRLQNYQLQQLTK